METLVVELKHKNALQLLRDLEALEIIRLHGNAKAPEKLSEKYRGIISKEEGQDLISHSSQTRDEWSDI